MAALPFRPRSSPSPRRVSLGTRAVNANSTTRAVRRPRVIRAMTGNVPMVPPQGRSEDNEDSLDASWLRGTWSRVPIVEEGDDLNANVQYLVAHGHDVDAARSIVREEYVQEWSPNEQEPGAWDVTTRKPGRGASRTITYPLGEWEESFSGASDIFGKDAATVHRHTALVSRQGGVRHITESGTPLGWETTERYLSATDGTMVVRRTFLRRLDDGSASDDAIVCDQTFERVAAAG